MKSRRGRKEQDTTASDEVTFTEPTPEPEPDPKTEPGSDAENAPGAFAVLFEKLQRTRVMRANTNLGENSGGALAAGMSYQALFAVFAALWVGFTTFGFILRRNDELLATVVRQLDLLVPGLFGEGGAVDIESLLNSPGLTWSTVIAAGSLLLLVVTWFTSTRTAIRMLNGMETLAYKNAILLKLRDLALAFLFGLLIVLTAAMTILTSSVMDGVFRWLGLSEDSWLFGWMGSLLRLALMLLNYWFVLYAIHRWLAEVPLKGKRLWIDTLPGAVVLLIITLLGSSLLGGATRNPLLAPFAVIIGLLLWFNFICRTLLFTSSWIAAGRDNRRGLPLPLQEKDRKEEARRLALENAGINPEDAEGIDANLLEPYARLNRH